MKRNLETFSRKLYDLLIVGGGVYGAAAAWDAALRGFSVALIEQSDFGGATSANSSKIAHGGLRYLQHADFVRMRESIRERSTLMRIAPHLVYPLAFLMPAYGHGIKGRACMAVALAINDVISMDRKFDPDPARRIPNGYTLSKTDTLKRVSGIRAEGLSGGAVWYDGQIHNTERLTLAFIRSAVEAGAHAVNYVRWSNFIQTGCDIKGAEVCDLTTGKTTVIRARHTLNTAGPWVEPLLRQAAGRIAHRKIAMSKVISLVTRPVVRDTALALPAKPMYQDQNAVLDKKTNMLFVVPWRDSSIVGSLHLPFSGSADDFRVGEKEIRILLDHVNGSLPTARLERNDVRRVLSGLLPADQPGSAAPDKHYKIIDHETEDGISGLTSVVGVKYTTARDVAEKAVDLAARRLGGSIGKSKTARTNVYGGDIDRFDEYLAQAVKKKPYGLNETVIRQLVFNYGTAYPEVLKYAREDSAMLECIPGSESVIRAEVLHAVKREMAVKLSDVVFRRTPLGAAGHPGRLALCACAEIMARELEWDGARSRSELNAAEAELSTVKEEMVAA